LTIHTVIADNQAIFRAGAARVLSAEVDIRIVGQCDQPQRLTEMTTTMRGCVLLAARALITDLPALSALAKAANSRLIVLTERDEVLRAEEYALIDGLLCRHTNGTRLVDCVRRVGAGERMVTRPVSTMRSTDAVGTRVLARLNHRELQIVGYIVRGCKNREIADEIGTKEQVVKNYLRTIYDKTGVSDRLELALFTLHHPVLAEAAAKVTDPALRLQTA
jgi:DNA-binding NarL/FixJ family response regulator